MEDNGNAYILVSNAFTLLNCFRCPPPSKVLCTSSRQLSPLPLLYVMITLSAKICTFILSWPLSFPLFSVSWTSYLYSYSKTWTLLYLYGMWRGKSPFERLFIFQLHQWYLHQLHIIKDAALAYELCLDCHGFSDTVFVLIRFNWKSVQSLQ